MSRDDEIKKALENHRDVLDIVSEYFEVMFRSDSL